jgi:hypothetical protein
MQDGPLFRAVLKGGHLGGALDAGEVGRVLKAMGIHPVSDAATGQAATADSVLASRRFHGSNSWRRRTG